MIYGIFIAINLVIAILNNKERIHNIKTGNKAQINHTLWFVIYLALCVPVWFSAGGPALFFAVFLQHGCLFPMFYNLIALGWNKIFNLSTTTTSKYDQAILKSILWLNWKFNLDIAPGMFFPDLLIFIASIFLLWIY